MRECKLAYLLVGGVILACVSMGQYAVLIFIPALGSLVLLYTVSWQSVHVWTFLLQMAWQTGCHLWLMYRQHYLEETLPIKLTITISSLMLLTQKVTSLAMDLHERKVALTADGCMKKSSHIPWKNNVLYTLSYLMFFPALLGGPLCSFVEFQQQVSRASMCTNLRRAWTVTRGCMLFMLLQALQVVLIKKVNFEGNLMDCKNLQCVYVMWSTALLFKLTYYSHWLLDEALFHTAGFSTELYSHMSVCDGNIFTLETTNKISVFARTWNKSTAKWLRRLIFQNCQRRRTLYTFAFSAWWHGLHPGQIFGFLCWAVMLEADYRIHKYYGSKPFFPRVLYNTLTWLQTQLIIAYIMLAVEMKNLAFMLALCFSYNTIFPAIYCILLFLLPEKKGAAPKHTLPHR
ncbi:ghrelin O-acyltransferase [Hyperolius riggenbachi]|uniref:ghrelin O-acyltransferase n=1 Tax=Hyperolius riggenbachi TaxID=752182 RepID=UPI0035A2B58D